MSSITAIGLRKEVVLAGSREPLTILDGIDFSAEAGEFVAIVGPSGAGKSALMNCLSGLDRASSGSVIALGSDLGRLGANALSRFRSENVSVVFQDYNVLTALTALENVELPLRLRRRQHSRRIALDALAAVGLAEKAGQHPVKLSGGEQQRVAIARALAVESRLIFADEPTGALDVGTGEQVLGLLRAQAERGATVIVITHDLEATTQADRVVVLADGAVRATLARPTEAEILEALRSPELVRS